MYLEDASVIFSIDPAQVVDVHIEWQNRYIDGLVRPQLRGIARDSAARYGVEDIYSIKRDDLATEIEDALRITPVSYTHLTLPTKA